MSVLTQVVTSSPAELADRDLLLMTAAILVCLAVGYLIARFA